jgi:hypothetical protein
MFGIETAKYLTKQAGTRALQTARYLGQQAGQTRAISNIEEVDRVSLHDTVQAEVIELTLPNSKTEAESIASSLAGHLAALHESGGHFEPVTQTEHQALQQVAQISGVLIDGQTINIPRPRSPI